MALRFRLKGLAETCLDRVICPECGHNCAGETHQGECTKLTKVTFDGIIVVIECAECGYVFVPKGQRFKVINQQQLRFAVEKDSFLTGEPLFTSLHMVHIEVEKLNMVKMNRLH